MSYPTKTLNLKKPRGMAPILFTTEACSINSRSEPGLPLIRDHEFRVVHVLNDYIRFLRVFKSHPTETTIRQYAVVLRDFWNFLLDLNVEWKDVDDEILIQWRNHQLNNGLLKQTINYNLSVTLYFYVWAQSNGYIHQQIGYGPQPDGTFVDFPISIKPMKFGSGGKLRSGFTSDIKFKTTARPKTYNPTDSEVQDVKDELWDQSEKAQVTTRNVLIVTWASNTGLRRKEILGLNVDQIPTWERINDLLENEQSFQLTLRKTKGDKIRTVPVHPALLQQTREYIENERKSLVARFKVKAGYHTPTQIFLSEKTGSGLTDKAVTNLITQSAKCRNAKVSLHPLRGRFLTKLVSGLLDAEIEKHGPNNFDQSVVLLKAMEIAGHNHASTLDRYLKMELKKRSGTSKTEKARFKEEYLTLLDQQIRLKRNQL